MMKDYSLRYSTVVRSGQKICPKKRRLEKTRSGKVIWRTVGVFLSLTMVLGIVSSVWFGRFVANAVQELTAQKAANHELHDLNGKLLAKWDSLLEHERVENSVRDLGLYPPADGQIRHP